MMYYFNKSEIGYSHIKNGKLCQDYSASFSDNERTIVTCCDGHGGAIYVRSHVGARFASEAIMKVFKSVTQSDLRKLKNEAYLNSLKLGILCEWNRLVEEHLSTHRIKKENYKSLTEEEYEKLRENKVKAYGTTLIGAMVMDRKLLVVHLGDGESLLIKNNEIINPFESDDDPVGNITYSMCEEDAFKHIRIDSFNFDDYDGIILCTDGLVNPYRNYDNFNKSLVIPLTEGIDSNGNLSAITLFVENMARNLGIGDDVSLSFIYKNKKERYLRRLINMNYKLPYNDYYKTMYGNKK